MNMHACFFVQRFTNLFHLPTHRSIRRGSAADSLFQKLRVLVFVRHAPLINSMERALLLV